MKPAGTNPASNGLHLNKRMDCMVRPYIWRGGRNLPPNSPILVLDFL